MVASDSWVEDAPKAELHVHLDGLLGQEELRTLHAAGLASTLTPEALGATYPVRSKDDWLNRYGVAVESHLTPDVLTQLLRLYVRALVAQNATYAEIMITGQLDIGNPDPAPTIERFRHLRTVADDAAENKVRVEFLACFGRGPRGKLERQVNRVIDLYAAGQIAGMALAGEETFCSCESSADLFAKVAATGMGIEIHAGEWSGPESVTDALKFGRPDRLGHALAAFKDPRLIEEIARRSIHVEFCPTSNLKVSGAVRRIEDHPIGQAIEAGLSFSINTDDPGPFECSLTSEWDLVARAFELTPPDLEHIHRNTVAAGFGEGRRT